MSTASWSSHTSHNYGILVSKVEDLEISSITPSHATMRNSSSSSRVVSVVYGDPTTNSFILASPSDRVTARTPGVSLALSDKLTIDAIIHDESARIGDPLRLMRVAPLMIVREPNRFSTAAVVSLFTRVALTIGQLVRLPHSPCKALSSDPCYCAIRSRQFLIRPPQPRSVYPPPLPPLPSYLRWSQ